MNKLIKFFPLLPAEKDTGALILAILFYMFVPGIVAMVVGALLGLTIILLPLSFVVGLVASVYTIMGIVFAVMKFCGKEI